MNNYSALDEAFSLVNLEFKEPEFRLYYNDEGYPLVMSSGDYPNGNYIAIDRETYNKGVMSNMLVVNNELTYTDVDNFQKQLHKADSGYQVVMNNPSLILEEFEKYEKTEYYGKRN